MTGIMAIVASNAIISAVLALVAAIVTWFWRSPQLAHGLWLLVLLKLVTPPFVTVSPPGGWLPETRQQEEPWSHSALYVLDRPSIDEDPKPHDATAAESASRIGVDSLPADTIIAAAPLNGDETAEPTPLPAPRPTAVPPPPTTAFQYRHQGGDTAAAPFSSPLSVDRTTEVGLSHWRSIAAIIWIIGAVAYIILLAWRCLKFRRVLAASTEASTEISASAARLASQLGLRRSPRLRVVDAAIPPLVWSLGVRPLVVLPTGLLSELTPAACDTLIAHELAHVRRRDYLIRWLEVFALVGFWWHPVAWHARRKLREAEEECCDAWVVWALPSERKSYGEAMFATIEFLTDGPKLPALAGSAFGGSFYKRRIEMIMKRNMNRKISRAALGMIVLLAAAALPIVAQTTDSDGGQGEAKPQDSATGDVVTADEAGAAEDTGAANDTGVRADAAAGASADDAKANSDSGESSDAVNTADDSSSDANSAGSPTANRATSGKRSRSSRAAANPTRQPGSDDSLPDRISALERLLLGMADDRGIASSVTLPNFNVSPDEREQKLQEELLKLDVEMARSEIERARIEWQKSTQANSKQPGTVSEIEVERLRAAYRGKEIQLQRAETVLALFRRQAERQREETVGLRRYQQGRTRQETANARNDALTDARVKALRLDELARLRAQHRLMTEALDRLENQIKESPASPETWKALEEFLKTYRNRPEQGAKSDSSVQRYPGGFTN